MSNLMFVQLAHPGGEHHPSRYGTKWNIREDERGRFVSHARKFLKVKGSYFDGVNIGQGDLCFWGEWEPQSEVIKTITNPLEHGPRHIYSPYYTPPTSYKRLQNTDPFVYGPNFHYGFCRQPRSKKLKQLERGSIIMFGSSRRNQSGRFDFMLDTLVVVDRWLEHNLENYHQVLRGQVVDDYMDITLKAWYADKGVHGRHYRLYFGATPDSPVNYMYSFTPCLPYSNDTKGFEKPIIKIPGVTCEGLLQSYKVTFLSDADESRRLWDMVVQQVLDAGLYLGVHIDMPQRITERPTDDLKIVG